VAAALFWARADDPASRRLEAAPAVNEGFRETGSYRLHGPETDRGCALLIDDEILERAPDGAWTWTPGFYAGEVRAELRTATGLLSEWFRIDVSPDPSKAGREQFARMVEEIAAVDRSLTLGTEPATHRVGTLGTDRDPWLAFARLRKHAPAFLAAIRAVARRPRRRLVTHRELVAPQHVRRVDRHTVLAALRTSAVAALFTERHGDAPPSETLRIDVPRVEESLDSAANRCLLALTRGLIRRTRALRDELGQRVARDRLAETRTGLASRWPRRRAVLDELDADLRKLQRSKLFADVERPEISASGLNAISAAPLYARAWTTGWRALRPGSEGDDPNDRAWMTPSWEVFERWCFVRLLSLLGDRFRDLDWHPCRRPAYGSLAAWRGERAGFRLEVLLQPRFPAGRESSTEPWSVSQERFPDIVVIITRQGHRSFVVLDAKYRVGRSSVLSAMTSAHVYQDSLRLGEARPFGSLLLAPATTEAGWLEDIEFQRRHRVGVAPFGVDPPAELPSLLSDLITAES